MMTTSNRVILNTIFLYGKMVINIAFGLLTTRWILSALGVEDFGIYNLVAGIISMLSFLNAAMAGATQRYMSFYIGQNNAECISKAFYYSIIIHLIIAIIVLCIIELGGWYLIQNVLDIPKNKIPIAMSVLHILSVSCCFSIITVPYEAVLISNENMFTLSIFSIIENILRFGVAVLLLHILSHKLEIYAALTLLIIIVGWAMRRIYCRSHYKETVYTISKVHDMTLLKSMVAFASWNTIGGVCGIARGQGIAMIINIFYGVVVNASYSIANQVNGLLSYFSVAMMQSLRPQIVKSEGIGDRDRMNRLTLIACKYMFYLSAIFAVPLLLEMPYILGLWLKDVPEYAVQFCRLIIILTVISSLSSGLYTAVEAVGKIKWMQLSVGLLHIVNLPISYFLLSRGYPAYVALLCVCCEELVCCILRIIVAHHITGLKVSDYINKVIMTTIPIFFITLFVGLLLQYFLHEETFLRVAIISICCCTTFVMQCWYFGLNAEERNRFMAIIIGSKSKLCNMFFS